MPTHGVTTTPEAPTTTGVPRDIAIEHEPGPCRVLVVDDNPEVRLLLATALRDEGFLVAEAENGEEGLAYALGEGPDVILLDVSMPILDGIGLAKALRADDRTARVPLVFVTGDTDPRTQAQAAEVGAAGFFAKPFEPAAITAFLRRLASADRQTGAGSSGS